MKYYYDIHIHSVLSSCADVLQTPNNILNMCMLKDLDIISICDHNGAKQYEAIDKIKSSYDFLVIYGIEITVQEGFHVLAYFEKYEEIMKLDQIIDDSLNKNISAPNDQIICDEYDLEKETIPYYLNQKLKYSFNDIIKIVKELNGLVIPAHIERKNTGILDYISDFRDYDIDGFEVYQLDNIPELITKYSYLKKYKYINNSDAHDIDIIHEKINYMELDDLSFASFRKWLKL